MSDKKTKVDCLNNNCKCPSSTKPNVPFDPLGNPNHELAYQDLKSGSEVYTALLDFGMMAEALPPCFTSKGLGAAIENAIGTPNQASDKACEKDFIRYSNTRHTLTPRELGIPHPMAYYRLCNFIGDQWQLIQLSSFVSHLKNYIHVEKIENKPYIFKMGYGNLSKYDQEDVRVKLKFGARYRVDADISSFFPSIYTHAISWAMHGKAEAKKNRRLCCWHGNKLDKLVGDMNHGQTSGILIGPHASSVISELILTKIDSKLIGNDLGSYIRKTDDYEFYAKDEEEAHRFTKYLSIYLDEYELKLNTKKTKITPLPIAEFHWKAKLNQFKFPQIKNQEIGFPTCKDYLQLAEALGSEEGLMSPLKYAAKVLIPKLDNGELSSRATENTLITLLSLCVSYPYLCPTIGTCIAVEKLQDKILKKFIKDLLKKGVDHQYTDAIAYGLYFAKKYKIKLCEDKSEIKLCEDKGKSTFIKDKNKPSFICKLANTIFDLQDCISMVLLHEYISTSELFSQEPNPIIKKLKGFAEEKNEDNLGDRDRYWLLIYTILDKESIKKTDPFLGKLKERGFSFIDWDRRIETDDI